MKDYPDVDTYVAEAELWPEEIREVRPLLQDAGLEETIKWGKPVYAVGDANVVIVQELTGFLALLFVKGILLDDPHGLLHEQGPNTHAARRVQLTSVEEVSVLAPAIRALLTQAIRVERDGVPLPPRPDEPLADELAERLAADPDLSAAFDELTPGRRREYNLHISGAKQPQTRQRRVDAVVPRIMAGKGLRDR